ncbi:class I SAM-dependent DNA methyltransferase [Fodinibius sp. Rm-B-1B1-1]|uniref:class I SAM-dependent DNA methyltransferase n=1 Tax=Fodinibius alkaliphilus TaxID=3140241 RepID=UPI00315AD3D6
MNIFNIKGSLSQQERMQNYYRLHAHIYDNTRWSFLFGRASLVDMIPKSIAPSNILEIGCGTGYMLRHLHQQFSSAKITGIDISPNMLAVAQKNVSEIHNISLKEHKYGPDNIVRENYDLILLSYSLTMMEPHPQTIIDQLTHNLTGDGVIAVVDFNATPFSGFKHWMHLNHVRFSADTLPYLSSSFSPIKSQTKPAYFGLWTYYQFLGRKV